ncbi:hypothetical protein Lal_00015439 [Lupinus albus]|nr:hypothetical protein Lal_00015439 [Lupinus albus]
MPLEGGDLCQEMRGWPAMRKCPACPCAGCERGGYSEKRISAIQKTNVQLDHRISSTMRRGATQCPVREFGRHAGRKRPRGIDAKAWRGRDEDLCGGRGRRLWREASGSGGGDRRHRGGFGGRRRAGRHRRLRQGARHRALDQGSGREPGAHGCGGGDPRHADAGARLPGDPVPGSRQACAGRNPDGRHSGRRGAAGGGAEGHRAGRHGRAHASLQPQPPVDPQPDQGRRADDPADGRADLLLPPLQHERAGQAADLDRPSAVAPRLPHGGPVPIPDRRSGQPCAGAPGAGAPAAGHRHGHEHRHEGAVRRHLHPVAVLQQRRAAGHLLPLHLRQRHLHRPLRRPVRRQGQQDRPQRRHRVEQRHRADRPTPRKAFSGRPIVALQTEYPLWTRNPEIAVLDACRALGGTFVAFSPLARGPRHNAATQDEIDTERVGAPAWAPVPGSRHRHRPPITRGCSGDCRTVRERCPVAKNNAKGPGPPVKKSCTEEEIHARRAKRRHPSVPQRDPLFEIPMAGVLAVLLHCAARRLRHGRHRLHRPVAHHRVGDRQAGAGAGPERGAVRPGLRRAVRRPSGRPPRPQDDSDRLGADHRPRLSGLRLLGQPRRARHSALRHRPWPGCRHAELRHADERILSRGPARHGDQRHVLRLSARRCPWRLPGRLDDPAMGLAQRSGARRRHAAGADGPAVSAAAGIDPLHGRPQPCGGAHPHRAAPYFRNGRRSDILRAHREGPGDQVPERHRRRSVAPLHRRFGDAVDRLLHGSGDLLRADQLDADPVQGRGAGGAQRRPDLRAVPAGRCRCDPVGLADGPLQRQQDHCRRFRADLRRRLCGRPGGRQSRAADGVRLRCRHHHEHRPIVPAGAGGQLLPDARARHRRGLDAGPGPVRRHRRFLPGRRAVAPAAGLQRHLHDHRHSGPGRRPGPDGQAVHPPGR